MKNKLQEWQRENKVTNEKLAQMVGVSESYISHINKRRRKPSPKIAVRIEAVTGGYVKLLELLFPKK